jgi:hypothetical protein
VILLVRLKESSKKVQGSGYARRDSTLDQDVVCGKKNDAAWSLIEWTSKPPRTKGGYGKGGGKEPEDGSIEEDPRSC